MTQRKFVSKIIKVDEWTVKVEPKYIFEVWVTWVSIIVVDRGSSEEPNVWDRQLVGSTFGVSLRIEEDEGVSKIN